MNANDCDPFEILISADLDGELDAVERQVLQEHLSRCASCRGQRSNWAALHAELSHLEFPAGGDHESPFSEITLNGWKHELFRDCLANNSAHQTIVLPPAGDPRHHARRGGRWLLGIAAGVLVALSVTFGLISQRQSQAVAVSAEPLVTMHAINVQAEQDQQALVRALAMELRTMKLEMRRLDMAPEARAELEQQIDSLLVKTRQLDSSFPPSFPGEIP